MEKKSRHLFHCAVVSNLLLACPIKGAILSSLRCDQISRGVVRVRATETGAGIISDVRSDRVFVVTAGHVVKGSQKVNVLFYDDRSSEFPGTVVRYDDDVDLAVVRVDAVPGKELPRELLKYRMGRITEVGRRVSIVGHPGNQSWICYMREYTVSQLTYRGDPRKFMFSSPVLREGMSGGPVFDEDSSLVGIIYERSGFGDQAAIGMDAVVQRLQLWDVPYANLLTQDIVTIGERAPQLQIRLPIGWVKISDDELKSKIAIAGGIFDLPTPQGEVVLVQSRDRASDSLLVGVLPLNVPQVSATSISAFLEQKIPLLREGLKKYSTKVEMPKKPSILDVPNVIGAKLVYVTSKNGVRRRYVWVICVNPLDANSSLSIVGSSEMDTGGTIELLIEQLLLTRAVSR